MGKNINFIRKEKNLTLKEFAHSIGKDPQSIYRVENGGVNPSYLYLLELSEGFGITIEELLKEKL